VFHKPQAQACQTLPPIIKTTIKIFFLFFLASCADKKTIPRHSDIFHYVDKKTGDTTKFYGYRDIDTAIYYAKNEKKDILLIFSGWACMDTPGKEWQTLCLYKDINKLYNNFILTWLPVDDKTTAKDTTRIGIWNGQKWKLKSIGDQNHNFELETFKYSSVPLFCFIDTLKKPFGKTIGWTSDKKEIEDFINSGLTK
jgi:hypothetical protein